jgi:sugar O-acyltransferase (sialic acid O-acetyltransferase NeuD family)
MSSVAIIGAGGHTRTLIHLLELNGIHISAVFDEIVKSENETILSYPVKPLTEVTNELKVVISKGDVQDKLYFAKKYKNNILLTNLIHPKAIIETSLIGNSNQISAGTYLAPTCEVGDQNVIYSGSVIEHESCIGNFNTITVNVSICGRVKIGDNCYIGAGAVILPNITIADNVTIGAGSVVTKNIPESGTYIGIPAKKVI